jgi:hypothetical protein
VLAIGHVGDHDGAGCDDGIDTNANALNHGRVGTYMRSDVDDDCSAEGRPWRNMDVGPDFAVVIDKAPGIADRVVAHSRTDSDHDRGSRDGSDADRRRWGHDGTRVHYGPDVKTVGMELFEQSASRTVVAYTPHADEDVEQALGPQTSQFRRRPEHGSSENFSSPCRWVIVDESDQFVAPSEEGEFPHDAPMPAGADHNGSVHGSTETSCGAWVTVTSR